MNQEKEHSYLAQIYEKNSALYAKRYADSSADELTPLLMQSLAELATRLQVVEELLLAENPNSAVLNGSHVSNWPCELTFQASDFGDNLNLYTTESFNDKTFRWSADKTDIDLALPVNRNKHSEITVLLVALIKPEFAKQLRIYIDGKPYRHRVKQIGGFIQLVIKLPKLSKTYRVTSMRISLPNTYSPSELEIGQDERKLGVAIHSVKVSTIKGFVNTLFFTFRR